ncbi:NAD(P)/FAD-dependent oxidoreductase [Desulfatirhabdium butyrativorans]|uniref:NAD(P)/FAD-dependent oxidoreductase n=1 Tax=Desulfatirhabdium butyrativorans TaxID=340467 RepID=UPI000405FC17|nr:FAD-dependent oxidoreductase [Desulfatirhabdium butyrativorans]
MNQSADIVVIGGGVIGCACAYFLARAGMDAVLIEKHGIASGTSSHCEGNVLVQDKMPGYDSQLARLSQELFPGVVADLDREVGWRRPGTLLVAESEAELAVAEDFCRQMAQADVPVRFLDASALHRAEPNLAADLVGGLEFPTDGCLNPMLFCVALAEAVQRMGARVMAHTEVLAIETDSAGAISAVVTENGRISTRAVVNAAGVWSPAIGAMVGLSIPVRPRQGQILVSERTAPIATRSVVEFGYLMAKFGNSGYRRAITPEMERYNIAFVYEPTDAGNFLIGSSRLFTGMNTHCDIPVLRALAARALRFFPVMRSVSIIRSYAGLRPYTPDHFPIVSASSVPGFFVATGHEGDGIGLSMITGKLMTQIVKGIEPDIDTTPLRLDRFD